MGISPHRGPVLGDRVGDTAFWRTLRDRRYFVLRGDVVYLGIHEVCKRRLWKRISLSIGAPLGNLEGESFYRGLRETDGGLWKRSVSSCGSSTKGT